MHVEIHQDNYKNYKNILLATNRNNNTRDVPVHGADDISMLRVGKFGALVEVGLFRLTTVASEVELSIMGSVTV